MRGARAGAPTPLPPKGSTTRLIIVAGMKARTEKVPDELEGEVSRLRGELACYPPPPVAVKVNGPFCRIPSKSRNWLRRYWDDSRVFRADIDRDIAPGEYVNDSQFAALHRTRPTTISILSGSPARCARRRSSWPASRLAMFATRPTALAADCWR
jgi:hypothetical protein